MADVEQYHEARLRSSLEDASEGDLARALSAKAKESYQRARRLEDAARALDPDLIAEPLPASVAATEDLGRQLGEMRARLSKREAELDAALAANDQLRERENAAARVEPGGMPPDYALEEAGWVRAAELETERALLAQYRKERDDWQSLAEQRLSEVRDAQLDRDDRVAELGERIRELESLLDEATTPAPSNGASAPLRVPDNAPTVKLRDAAGKGRPTQIVLSIPASLTPVLQSSVGDNFALAATADLVVARRVGAPPPKSEPAPEQKADPDSDRRLSAAMVRDAVVANYGSGERFTVPQIAGVMGVSVSGVRRYVDELAERGIVTKVGTRGPLSGFAYVNPKTLKGPTTTRRVGEDDERKVGVGADAPKRGQAVAHTGRPMGAPSKPGEAKKLAAKGKRVRRKQPRLSYRK